MEQMQYHTTSTEYGEAFRSVRCAKTVLWLLLGLAILTHLAGFVLVHFAGAIDETVAATAPATGPSGTTAGLSADAWRHVLHWALPAAKFVALLTCLLLALTLLFSVDVSLLGRLGGVAGFVSAFFWCLILLAMVVPWQQVLGGAAACGALGNLGDLTRQVARVKPSWGAANPSSLTVTLYYARFLGYPIVALLVWLLVQIKFTKGYHRMALPPVVTVGAPPPPAPEA